MGFEMAGGDAMWTKSPGGFEFGIQGFQHGPPVPKSITFFLDGSAMIHDQYGRPIRAAVGADSSTLRFADVPPDGNREGTVTARPQFATHAQTIAALAAEQIDWLAYEVRWRDRSGQVRGRGRLTLAEAVKLQAQLAKDGYAMVVMERTISCAGWPQLPYEELKKLPEVPPTPASELCKIPDPALRRDALRLRHEADAARVAEVGTQEAVA